MRRKPLRLQIWFLLCAVLACLFVIMLAVLRPTLSAFFTKETYRTIEIAQSVQRSGNQLQRVLEGSSNVEQQQERQNIRSVQHFAIFEDRRLQPAGKVPARFELRIREQAAAQGAASQRYDATIDGETMYYVITKHRLAGRSIALVSYMWNTYQNELTQTLFQRLALLFAIITVLGLLPSWWLASYLTRPIRSLQHHVRRIANRQWKEAVQSHRRDEIGELANDIERMRVQLVRNEEARQEMLQHVSHELKTPVMVIHSYAQAILDGIYPKGSVEASVQVIEGESERLTQRIGKLLYLTKLDYIADRSTLVQVPVQLNELTEATVERLRWRRPELTWDSKLETAAKVYGDEAQLTALVENLVDNAARFATTRIEISVGLTNGIPSHARPPVPPPSTTPALQDDRRYAVLRIWNDGEPLSLDMEGRLFQPFQKGDGGQFGLGLAIVSRVAELHGGRASAANEQGGVRFTVWLNAEAQK